MMHHSHMLYFIEQLVEKYSNSHLSLLLWYGIYLRYSTKVQLFRVLYLVLTL